MFGDYKSYKKFAPQYSEWKAGRDSAEAKRVEYLRQNPSEIKHDDIQKSKAILRAVDIMDEYSQKKAENTEVATESIISYGATFAMTLGSAIGFLFRNNKMLLNLCSKFIKNKKAVPGIAQMVSIFAGGILGITAASFPLYAWAAKAETKASRKGRFEAMRKELSDPKTFATLNAEQEEALNKNLLALGKAKENKNPFRSLKESWETVKDIVVDSDEYIVQKIKFEKKIEKDKKLFDEKLNAEEIEDAKRDQQLLTKLLLL